MNIVFRVEFGMLKRAEMASSIYINVQLMQIYIEITSIAHIGKHVHIHI